MSGAGTADFFYREALRLGYVARSAFKLLQMQKQYRLIRPGDSVLDLGCAPGAWLQVACQGLGPFQNGGSVVGIDMKKVRVPSVHCDSRVQTVCVDVMRLLSDQARALSPQEKGFSVVLSDMCPAVSGTTTKDAALSCVLGMRALSLSVGRAVNVHEEIPLVSSDSEINGDGILHQGGNLVIKFLESEDIQDPRQPGRLQERSIWSVKV
ncbi:hypothetical protein QJS10_CPA03g01658 [Acorus calamus]|uniref:rRNA methyltransferase 2, mitochondrial n=1 Tax=Acorus calamus TaxID=4465 RepID=A0AAV9F7G2_ACOCL|nr:hypothetical protein QJS10_CPA03g01658 [Acorus calamus]